MSGDFVNVVVFKTIITIFREAKKIHREVASEVASEAKRLHEQVVTEANNWTQWSWGLCCCDGSTVVH